ncbi:tRNA (N6-threonylcarbamoyladenosine(37)-N6)-methyltransferase TrmO [Candidatus Pacearchaeota archaeon]|nr:tRNA (N6-threonylcarbamoyladenosine(37)-N6)-methyltransferase TrmO [Candidatus Pacearchaeota archaeon]
MVDINLEFIGKIVSDYSIPEELHFECEKGLKTVSYSKIILKDKYIIGLKGLEQFSHIFVIYILDKADRIELITHPGPSSIKDLKKVGVFASRSQYRPNHIALRLAKLMKINNNELIVEGLDAVNGSKVLDIKPYIPGFDRPNTFKVAEWYDWLK